MRPRAGDRPRRAPRTRRAGHRGRSGNPSPPRRRRSPPRSRRRRPPPRTQLVQVRPHAHPSGFQLAHEADVDHRRPLLRERAPAGPPEPVGGQIAEREAAHLRRGAVDGGARERAEQDPEELHGDAGDLTGDDRRRSAHRDLHAARALLGEVGGDLGPAVPDADDEHLPADERPAGAVVSRMDDRAAECLRARKAGKHLAAMPPRGDDDCAAAPAPVVGLEPPPALRRGDHADVDLVAHVERKSLGVLLEVASVVVLRDEAPVRTGNRVEGKPREAAGRMQVQAVVAPAPGRSDPLVPVDDDRPAPMPRQARRRRESGGAGPDHDDLRLLRRDHAARRL